MKVAPVERPIASSSYSFVRFAGGAIAPYLAGKLAEWVAPDDAVLRRRRRGGRALLVLLAGRAPLRRGARGRGRRAGARPAPVLVAVGDHAARRSSPPARPSWPPSAAPRRGAARARERRAARRGRGRPREPAEARAVLEAARPGARGRRPGRRRSSTRSATTRTSCGRCSSGRRVGAQLVVVGASTHRGHRVGAELTERADRPVIVVPVAA